jgi:phosphate acyltransferase
MRISIDAFGGDHAPEAIVEGAVAAAKEWSDVTLTLVGDESRIRELLAGNSAPPNVHVRHASDVISGDEEPVRAVRRKKNSSMVVAASMVREGEADAFISAGNTGALMAAGLLVVGRLSGIERPALAPMIPTVDGSGMLALDLGANMDASPEQLKQYAVMGSIYRRSVHGIAEPRVGLLNVGTEPGKGNELTKAAFPLLSEAPIRFVGNVEARDVLSGVCDVLVCDGFAGNVMLKALEGTASTVFSALKTEFTRTTLTKLAAVILRPGLKSFKDKLDYKEHGAAPLLGLSGVVMKCHGSSDARAIRNAVRQTRLALEKNVVGSIADELGKGER